MNKKRIEIYNKSNGHCFYCGCKLGEKGWHADHFHPVIRQDNQGKKAYPELDCNENLVPACAPCNLFKSTYDIEFLRIEIAAQFNRVRAKSMGFKMLERMGLITCHESEPIKFWFERNGIEMKTKANLLGLHDDVDKVEWKYDKRDGFYFWHNERIVTLRNFDNKWLAIATDCEWNQFRIEIDMCCLNNAKEKIADWALRGFDAAKEFVK